MRVSAEVLVLSQPAVAAIAGRPFQPGDLKVIAGNILILARTGREIKITRNIAVYPPGGNRDDRIGKSGPAIKIAGGFHRRSAAGRAWREAQGGTVRQRIAARKDRYNITKRFVGTAFNIICRGGASDNQAGKLTLIGIHNRAVGSVYKRINLQAHDTAGFLKHTQIRFVFMPEISRGQSNRAGSSASWSESERNARLNGPAVYFRSGGRSKDHQFGAGIGIILMRKAAQQNELGGTEPAYIAGSREKDMPEVTGRTDRAGRRP